MARFDFLLNATDMAKSAEQAAVLVLVY